MTCDTARHQELLRHGDVTMIYTHVLNRGPSAVRSSADRLLGPRGYGNDGGGVTELKHDRESRSRWRGG